MHGPHGEPGTSSQQPPYLPPAGTMSETPAAGAEAGCRPRLRAKGGGGRAHGLVVVVVRPGSAPSILGLHFPWCPGRPTSGVGTGRRTRPRFGWLCGAMEGGFGSDFGSSGGGKLDPGLIMEQVKVQIAVANAQELLQVWGRAGAGSEGGGVRCGRVSRLSSRVPTEDDGQVLPEVHREAGGLPGQLGTGETGGAAGRHLRVRGPAGVAVGPLRVRGRLPRGGGAGRGRS